MCALFGLKEISYPIRRVAELVTGVLIEAVVLRHIVVCVQVHLQHLVKVPQLRVTGLTILSSNLAEINIFASMDSVSSSSWNIMIRVHLDAINYQLKIKI